MLWSLLKIVLFICAIAALALGAEWLMEADGTLQLAVAGTEFTLGPLQSVIAVLLLVLAVWILLKILGLLVAILRFVNGDETAITRHFSRNRERKGLNALADAMLALASGEGKEAQAKAQRADRYLNRPDLTNLLLAQSHEMTGETRKAEDVYKQLLRDDRTRFVGVRGLMKQKLEAGDTDTAMALAERAFALKPKHVETQDTLLRLQAARHDWTGARNTLGAKLKHGSLPRDVHRRRDAVLALSEARDLTSEDTTIEAREAAIEANRLSPDLIPAAIMAAQSYISRSQNRYATRVLKRAWDAQPHPDIAATFAEIVPGETPQQRIRRFNTLTKLKPDHSETKMLLAELHIANEDFPAARRALGDLATASPTARSVTIMAAIERGEGADDAIVRGWLTKAVHVPRGPQWVCENCHAVHATWDPICGNCGAFDTMAWREPREGIVAMPAQTEMLPLIVGQVEESHPPVVEDAPASREETPPVQGPVEPESDHVEPAPTPDAETAPMPQTGPSRDAEIPEAEVIVSDAPASDEDRAKREA